jgi:fructose-1,6-bisphosphatase II
MNARAKHQTADPPTMPGGVSVCRRARSARTTPVELDRQRQQTLGYPLDDILIFDDLIAGDDVFVAVTGVTSGALLRGVRHLAEGPVTDSIVMRSRSGTLRRIEGDHALAKLAAVTSVD